jgi:hypothetical protein
MKKITLLIASVAMVLSVQAQSSRECIKQTIVEQDQCTSVAITENNGNAMIYGRCEWAAQGCPNDLHETLFELHAANVELQDIHLTELGRWLVLYNDNQICSDLLYENLKQKIASCQMDNEKITTVTFNDSGSWIVITTEQISASSDELMDWLVDGCTKYGPVWTACVTDEAMIAVYESGFKFAGNVPEDLKDALRACESDVYTVKLSNSSWLFRCTDGHGAYNL